MMRDGPPEVSFESWSEADPLPQFDYDVTGFDLFSPGCFPEEVSALRPDDYPSHCPDHENFALSFVRVPASPVPGGSSDLVLQPGPVPLDPPLSRSLRVPSKVISSVSSAVGPLPRKPVSERWFYKSLPADASTFGLLSQSTDSSSDGGLTSLNGASHPASVPSVAVLSPFSTDDGDEDVP